MDHPPSASPPSPLRMRVLWTALGMGLGVAALGGLLGRNGWTVPGVLLAAAGALALAVEVRAIRREARGRQGLLSELNRNLDEQVNQRTQRLMKTIEDLESFNRMVTHDLNSPLAGLMLGLERLSEQLATDPDERRRALVQSIAEAATRMQSLIHDLRELALTSGRITVIQAVDLSAHAALVLRTLREREPARPVVWTIEPELRVHGDPSLIRIALENLLGNAWKFTAEREPAEIRVRRVPGESHVIEIADNGCGFDPDKADRLFQPFFRAHDDPRYPGSGLGLSIVRRVMSRHGGQVSASSRPGKGTTFRLTFPVVGEPPVRQG